MEKSQKRKHRGENEKPKNKFKRENKQNSIKHRITKQTDHRQTTADQLKSSHSSSDFKSISNSPKYTYFKHPDLKLKDLISNFKSPLHQHICVTTKRLNGNTRIGGDFNFNSECYHRW